MRHLSIAAVLLAATTTLAADPATLKGTTPTQRATALTAAMKTKLALTDEQMPKIAALNQKYAEKMEPIINGNGGPLEKMREGRQLQEAKEAELKELLSPEQFQKFLAMKAEM